MSSPAAGFWLILKRPISQPPGRMRCRTGLLTVTAPVMFGMRSLRPVIDEFLAAYPTVQIRYLLLDRQRQPHR